MATRIIFQAIAGPYPASRPLTAQAAEKRSATLAQLTVFHHASM